MPRKLVIWSKLLANSLLEKWKKKLLVLKIITPCSSLQVWIFFLNTRIFFLSWQVGGVRFEWEEFSPEEKSGANSRSPLAFRKKKKKFLFFLKLGVSTVALDMNSSAWGAAALMPGDSHLAQQDTPQWTPQQPRDHTGPDHQHPEGQPCSIFGEEMREKRASVVLILKARDPLLTSIFTSKGELSESYFSGSFLQKALVLGLLMGFSSRMWVCLDLSQCT